MAVARGRGGRFQNFISNAQSSWDNRDKHRGVEWFKCNQDGHIVKNCPYNNRIPGKVKVQNSKELH